MTTPASRQDYQAALQTRARGFSVPALLDALQYLGYRSEEITYRSNLSGTHQAALVHSIEFAASPHRRVVITLNIGLLAPQGPLPSYFSRLLSEYDGDAMEAFIGYFDHALLGERVRGLYPERDRGLLTDWEWEETKGLLLKLLGLQAPTSLHWLFRLAFPELGVKVQRSVQRHTLQTHGVQLGSSALGEGCAFGGETTVPAGGIDVTLGCEEAHSFSNLPWSTEAARRLRELIFPILRDVELYLSVALVFFDHRTYARLQPDHYLGYDPLYHSDYDQPEQRLQQRLQQVLLWSGYTRDA